MKKITLNNLHLNEESILTATERKAILGGSKAPCRNDLCDDGTPCCNGFCGLPEDLNDVPHC